MQALLRSNRNSLCVAADIAAWQIVGMLESTDKNGGPNNLKAWRLYRRLSKDKLADKVGTSANMIGYLEDGERALSLKWLRRLAPALGTTPGHLADHCPDDMDMEMHDVFVRSAGGLSEEDRRMVAKFVATLRSTGTDNK